MKDPQDNKANQEKEVDYAPLVELANEIEKSTETKPENSTHMTVGNKSYKYNENPTEPKQPKEDLKGGRWVDDKERGFRGKVMRFTENPEVW